MALIQKAAATLGSPEGSLGGAFSQATVRAAQGRLSALSVFL